MQLTVLAPGIPPGVNTTTRADRAGHDGVANGPRVTAAPAPYGHRPQEAL
ncbi:MAG TPA: hypothetical protein VFH77_01670 [Streptomyces sp.]|nr:hypothetical protein [Streptomyces sp.]